MERRAYKINPIVINKIEIEEVIIDSHVDKQVDGDFQYFVSEIAYDSKLYKMVWLLEDHKFYVGVITAFRDRRL